ncbi:hypothetical protein O181_078645 [Austropuccinia psidii MF-1]|uniref:RING-type domain-containing protein n=1 Tax=Austropuccinia psidii MF-1 TaxID=1389203 RepID=A0A9Q3IH55_9BASI|nr:hypothetical protein [Austropuccinia psidii MF-1]
MIFLINWLCSYRYRSWSLDDRSTPKILNYPRRRRLPPSSFVLSRLLATSIGLRSSLAGGPQPSMAPSRLIVLPACSICQDEDAPPDHIVTLCGHIFHSDCIRSWDAHQRSQKRPTRCPTCNVELKRVYSGSARVPGSRFVRLHSLSVRPAHLDSAQSDIPPSQSTHYQVSTLLASIRNQSSMIKELEHQATNLRSEKRLLEKSSNKMKDQLKDLQIQTDKQLQQIEQGQSHHQIELSIYCQEISKLKADIKNLNTKCRTYKSEGDGFQLKLKKISQVNDELESFIAEITNEKKLLQGIHDDLKKELKDYKNEVHTLRAANKLFKEKLKMANKTAIKADNPIHRKSHDISLFSQNKTTCGETSSSYLLSPDTSAATHESSWHFKRSTKRPIQHGNDDSSASQTNEIDSKRSRTMDQLAIGIGLDDSSLDLESEPLQISFPTTSIDAGKNLVLPSLFGNSSQRLSVHKLEHFNPSSRVKSSMSNRRSVRSVTGPKIKHKAPCLLPINRKS